MKVAEFKKLKVGDKVRVVKTKDKGSWNSKGKMDKWLGKVMTVRQILEDGDIRMVEDRGEYRGEGWYWSAPMIAKKVGRNTDVYPAHRKAKVGEWIKVTTDKSIKCAAKKGAVLKVYKTENATSWCQPGGVYCELPEKCGAPYRNDNGNLIILDSEYDVLVNYKPKVKEVKRIAKKGEYVKIVHPLMALFHYKEGDIMKVESESMYRNCVSCVAPDGVNVNLYSQEYVVLENYIPEEKVEDKKPEVTSSYKSAMDKFREACTKTWKDLHPTIVAHIVEGRKTIVKLSNGSVGIAVCSPDDAFDIYEGLRLATDRAYGKAEPYKKPSEVKEVKRHAKVGEWVKIVKPVLANGYYKAGDILKVADMQTHPRLDNDEIKCELPNRDGACYTVYDSEYVVLENYKPNKK